MHQNTQKTASIELWSLDYWWQLTAPRTRLLMTAHCSTESVTLILTAASSAVRYLKLYGMSTILILSDDLHTVQNHFLLLSIDTTARRDAALSCWGDNKLPHSPHTGAYKQVYILYNLCKSLHELYVYKTLGDIYLLLLFKLSTYRWY